MSSCKPIQSRKKIMLICLKTRVRVPLICLIRSVWLCNIYTKLNFIGINDLSLKGAPVKSGEEREAMHPAVHSI